MRRGAATDLMEQVGDALAASRVASVAGEKSMWWSPEKHVRTKMQVSPSGAKRNAGCSSTVHPPHALVVAHPEAVSRV